MRKATKNNKKTRNLVAWGSTGLLATAIGMPLLAELIDFSDLLYMLLLWVGLMTTATITGVGYFKTFTQSGGRERILRAAMMGAAYLGLGFCLAGYMSVLTHLP